MFLASFFYFTFRRNKSGDAVVEAIETQACAM